MILYLIQMVLCSGVLLATYFLLLEKEKMHRFNRLYLLFSVVFAMAVPFISIETTQTGLPFTEQIYVEDSTPAVEAISPSTPLVIQENKAAPNLWLIGYFVITALLLVRFVSNLMKIRSAVKYNRSIPYYGAQLVFIDAAIVPYSFLHYIFLNKNNFKRVEKEILCHELAHVKQHHSIDIFVIEVLLAVTWFNPFFWLYRKAIRMNHEYLADAAVINSFNDVRAYQYLLLNTIADNTPVTFCSSFNYLTTKKRLIMILTKTSPLAAGTRMFITIVLAGATCLFCSKKIIAQQVAHSTQSKGSHGFAANDTIEPRPIIGTSIGSTKEGVSEALLQEYQTIIKRYRTAGKTGLQSRIWNMPEEERSRLVTLFRQMNPEQQQKQKVAFVKPPKPLPKVVPTEEQLEKFKNASVYGVWIDEKKVANDALNNYNPTDFSQVFVSKLYGGAKKGRSYTHQLDLMTNAYFEKYYKEALQNDRPSMILREPAKTRIKQE